MSQSLLAQKTGIPQPNLSDMERGEREVSLRTLRALALALEIPAGFLADGVGPETEKPLILSRNRLERIARAISERKSLADPQEEQLAQKTALLMQSRLRAAEPSLKNPHSRSPQKAHRAWLSLSSQYRTEEIQTLVERVAQKISVLNSDSLGKSR